MIRFFLLILLQFVLLLPPNTIAQIDASGPAATSITGLSMVARDAFAPWNNQAGMAARNHFSVALAAEQRFLAEGFTSIALAGIIPLKVKCRKPKAGAEHQEQANCRRSRGSIGVSVKYFGNHLFNQHLNGLSYAMRIGEKLLIGLQFDHLGLHIAGHGDKHLFTFEGGLIVRLLEELQLGVHIFNPIKRAIQQFDLKGNVTIREFLPTYVRTGLAYRPSSRLTIGTELNLFSGSKIGVLGGLNYRINRSLEIHAGFSANPATFTFGLGMHFNGTFINLSTRFHPFLGYSPGMRLSFQPHSINEKEE